MASLRPDASQWRWQDLNLRSLDYEPSGDTELPHTAVTPTGFKPVSTCLKDRRPGSLDDRVSLYCVVLAGFEPASPP